MLVDYGVWVYHLACFHTTLRSHPTRRCRAGMWDRTVTVSSAGKTFSCTGWKIGWVVGPPHLVSGEHTHGTGRGVRQRCRFGVCPLTRLPRPHSLRIPTIPTGVITANQWVQYSVSTPAQQAVAWALERVRAAWAARWAGDGPRGYCCRRMLNTPAPSLAHPCAPRPQAEQPYEGFPSYYAWLRGEYIRKRDILMAGLASAGLKPVAPEGGFFIIADTSAVEVPAKCVRGGGGG